MDFPGRVGLLTHLGNAGKGWMSVDTLSAFTTSGREEFVHVKTEELSRR